MSWFPGTTSSGGPRPRRIRAPPPRARPGRPRWVRSPLATTSVGLDALDELARSPARAPDRRGRSARRSGGRTRGGCALTPSKQATVSDMAERVRERDLRRPLPRRPRRRRAAQAAPRRAADARRRKRRSAAGSASRRGARASRSAASPSAPSGSASPSAASSSAAGARPSRAATWSAPAARSRLRRHDAARSSGRVSRRGRRGGPHPGCPSRTAVTSESVERTSVRSVEWSPMAADELVVHGAGSTTSRTSPSGSLGTRSSASPGSPAPGSRALPSTRSTPRASAATSSRSRPTRASSCR